MRDFSSTMPYPEKKISVGVLTLIATTASSTADHPETKRSNAKSASSRCVSLANHPGTKAYPAKNGRAREIMEILSTSKHKIG
jgi:hypothetical protein